MTKTYLSYSVALLLVGCVVGDDAEDGDAANLAEADPFAGKPQRYSEQVLFRGGTDGYHSYRIPSIVTANDGSLLAFAEGRKNSHKDHGDIDIVMRKSTNDGNTWGPIRLVMSRQTATFGNPTAVVDRDTGHVWVFASWNAAGYSNRGDVDAGIEPITEWGQRRVYSLRSRDVGETWELANRTRELLPPEMAWDAVGPGTGIQITTGPNDGRLVIPAINRNIISDDHGETWHYEQLVDHDGELMTGTSESAIVETITGGIYRNDRGAIDRDRGINYATLKRRMVTRTPPRQATWSGFKADDALIDPNCPGSMLRYTPDRIVFMNPANTTNRRNLTVRISYDGGRTFPISRQLSAGLGAYTSMTKTRDYHVGAMVEVGGNALKQQTIVFRKFNLPWILNGSSEAPYR